MNDTPAILKLKEHFEGSEPEARIELAEMDNPDLFENVDLGVLIANEEQNVVNLQDQGMNQ